jgi:type II secretory ATPase GspE/PulE/Tfp pilus assembly ATPase PilB-like protein
MGDKKIAETVDMVIEEGERRGASAIHIEPHERFVLVRYRVEGALRGVHKLPRQSHGAILVELKRRADLDQKETRMPQEGEFESIRLATMPVFGGEKAVLHLKTERGEIPSLEELGFHDEAARVLGSAVAQPHGLVLVSGPKHNGVSTTLFALLKMLNSPLQSIATIEPAPTHTLPGASQTYLTSGIDAHLAFAATLKQDPNIIMVDELSDGETAKKAVQAAGSGHLVLTGLHAEDAASALTRLLHASNETYLLATSLKVATGQRLVRKLCTDCRQHYEVGLEERRKLQEKLGLDAAAVRKHFANLTHLWRPSESGCETCDHSGYKGRLGITEVLKPGPAVSKILLAREAPTASAIRQAALKDGLVPMAWDGLAKAASGQTSAAEVLRMI